MDITSFAIDLIKYVLAGCVVAGVANWLFWTKYNSHLFRTKMLEARQAARKEIMPLRLQARERLVLLTERINPVNLLVRLYQPGMLAVEFQQLLIADIQAEFQHNITQQLYVGDAAWSVVKQLKENTIALVRNAATDLPASAEAKELSSVVLAHLAKLAENPYDLALKAIKNELAG